MRVGEFEENKKILEKQYKDVKWIKDSGLSHYELNEEILKLEELYSSYPKEYIKAKSFELILTKGRIGVTVEEIFQAKVDGEGLLARQRSRWGAEVYEKYFCDSEDELARVSESGTYDATLDTGHMSPDTRDIINWGYAGLLERVRSERSKKTDLTENMKVFYESCEIVLSAMIKFLSRMAEAVKESNYDTYKCLKNIAEGKPENIYEAMQNLIIHMYIHEFIGGARPRTIGRLDKLLYPFYKNDINDKKFSNDEIYEMVKYFLYNIWAMEIPFDLPLMLGGIDENGDDVTNQMSYIIIEVYNSLNIYSPKIHIRISDKTPELFIRKILECIRDGNSSFLFVNDDTAIKTLLKTGLSEEEAKDYILIGCYEPAAWGIEIPCTGSGYINLPKAIEFAMTGGRDNRSNTQISVRTGVPETFNEFTEIVKTHIKNMCDKVIDKIIKLEEHFMEIYPDPLLSSTISHCVEKGADAYDGGAKYNNSSVNFGSIATLVDSVAAVKKLVFDDKLVAYEELSEILKNNWKGNEELRLKARNLKEKYGNENQTTDELMNDLCKYIAKIVNGHRNKRGGVFKAGLFSIDYCFTKGEKTMATPDGRYEGQPLSKNLCSVTAMDRGGVTGLINSVSKIDVTDFPNGSVLDFIVHPTVAKGEAGIGAMRSIIKTYFEKGGFAIHGNVFDEVVLRKAQKKPEDYETLQVRLCGWNAYFVKLSKAEQDEFIMQSENL